MRLWITVSVPVPTPSACRRFAIAWAAAEVRSFLARWLLRLPSPFTPTELQGDYGYELAFRQLEVSETCVFDRPQAGRMWFEGVIRDHLDVGRPDQMALIFQRRVTRCTPGRFRTRVVNRGVNPSPSLRVISRGPRN